MVRPDETAAAPGGAMPPVELVFGKAGRFGVSYPPLEGEGKEEAYCRFTNSTQFGFLPVG